jgi:hypothetical protein
VEAFADGSPDDVADLVFGADGVPSVTKNAVLAGHADNDQYSATYE